MAGTQKLKDYFSTYELSALYALYPDQSSLNKSTSGTELATWRDTKRNWMGKKYSMQILYYILYSIIIVYIYTTIST